MTRVMDRKVIPMNTIPEPTIDAELRTLAEAFAGRRVHFIGIGGTGVSGLAHMLHGAGAIVTGTDMEATDTTRKLQEMGIRISENQSAEGLAENAQIVVYSAAIQENHPELAAARRRGLVIYKYAQLLGKVMAYKHGIAIAGTHGKSTTTAMTAWILSQAGIDPSYVVGAKSRQLGGSSHGGAGDYFVVEACEYDRSFLNLNPRISAILNIEEDHLDYYKNIDEIIGAFTDFAHKLPPDGLLITQAGAGNCRRSANAAGCEIQTYGIEMEADWTATQITVSEGKTRCQVHFRKKGMGWLDISIPGRHNVGNALVAVAIAHRCGISWDVIVKAIREFNGVDRRSQLIGENHGITLVDDYGHHPSEIRATLLALRTKYNPQRLICVFQPHQHSRTRLLLEDFARSFSHADIIIVPDIFFVRDTDEDRRMVNAGHLVRRLTENGREAMYLASFGDIVEHLQQAARSGDLIVSMGAGPVWKITHELAKRL